MEGMLEPEEVEETVGTVEVRQIFRASKIGTIAGSYVTDGKVRRGAKVRLVRDGTVVYDGDDRARCGASTTTSARSPPGFECGIVLRELPGRQGRRRARGLRDAPGRARARLAGDMRWAPYVALLHDRPALPGGRSLKAKRKELRRSRRSCTARLGCAVAEVDHQDLWQRATLAAALTGGDRRRARARGRRRRALPGRALPGGRPHRADAASSYDGRPGD